jgi:hypothetical protein
MRTIVAAIPRAAKYRFDQKILIQRFQYVLFVLLSVPIGPIGERSTH